MGAILVADEGAAPGDSQVTHAGKLFTMKVISYRSQSLIPCQSSNESSFMPSKTPLNLLPPEDVDHVKINYQETGSRFAEDCRSLARLQPGGPHTRCRLRAWAARRRAYGLSRFDRAL
jgi:hypothetical protein